MSTARQHVPHTWTRSPRNGRRTDLRARDLRRFADGAAMRNAITNVKATAQALGCSVDAVERWRRGEDSNPLFRLMEAARACQRPEVIEVHVRVSRLMDELRSRDRADLERELDELTRDREPHEQYEEDRATQAWRDERQDRERLLGLAQGHEAEAAVSMRIAAIARVLLEPGR